MPEWLDSEAAWVLAGSGLLLGVGIALAFGRAAWLIRHAGSVLALLGAFSLLAGGALIDFDPPGLSIRLDPSTEPLLPARDPARDLYRRAILDFGDDEVFVIALECGEVFTTRCLSVLDRVSAELARIEGVRGLRSLLDVTSFHYEAQSDWVAIEPFMDAVPNDSAELARLRARALADSAYRETLVSADGSTAAVEVQFRSMSDARFIASGIDRRIRAILEAERQPGMRFHVAGRPHVKTHVYEGMLRDLRALLPLAVLSMALVLGLAFGARRGVVLPLAAAGLAVLWSFGLIAFVGLSLSLLTVLLAPMLLALGSVYAVHVLARYEHEARGAPDASNAALRALEAIRLPALLAGATTVAGFGALLISDVPAVFEFGIFSMWGVAASTMIALVGLPAALARLPLRAAASQGERSPRADAEPPARLRRLSGAFGAGIDAVLSRLADFVARHTRTVTLTWAGLAVLAVLAVPSIEIDTDYLSYFDREDPVRLEFEAVNRLLAGAVPLYVVLDGGRPGDFREPALLAAMERLQSAIDTLPGVGRTLSVLETLRALNRAFHADDPATERIPDSRAGVTELLFMLPKSYASRFLTLDHARANIVVRTGEVGSAPILRLAHAIEGAIAENPLPRGVHAAVSGNAILLSRSADGIARGQPLSIALATLAIFALVSLGLGSLRMGVLAMWPNLVPILLFFGLLGAGAAALSLPTSLVGSMALGLAIDDTVHYLVRYREARRSGASAEAAVRRSTRDVGRPIVITSLMLGVGYGVIAFSRFASLREFGLLSAATMAICLACDLVLLPALLLRGRAASSRCPGMGS